MNLLEKCKYLCFPYTFKSVSAKKSVLLMASLPIFCFKGLKIIKNRVSNTTNLNLPKNGSCFFLRILKLKLMLRYNNSLFIFKTYFSRSKQLMLRELICFCILMTSLFAKSSSFIFSITNIFG